MFFKKIPLFMLLLVMFSSCQSIDKAKKQQDGRPNFLFVMVDDQPYDALGIYERYPFLETPNMDRLAKEGANFTNFFVTQSICSPSRASFLTGTYPHIHGVNQNNPHVDPNWEAYPPYTSILQEQGYETAMVGKIHMAHYRGEKHVRPGFDYWFSFIGQGEYFNPEVNENGKEYQEEGYMTDILTDKAIDWLTEKRSENKPFNLCLWHKAVHEPHAPAPRHSDLYENTELPEPPFDMHKENFAGKPEWQRVKAYDSKWKDYQPVDSLPMKSWPIKEQKFKNLLKTLISVDESLGKVLDTLEEMGELDNTVVIFTSDNGYFMGEHTYWDKRIAYESSMRIPMLIRYPELIKPESEVTELCLNIDMAPTLLDLSNNTIPGYMQGESMVPLLDEEKDVDWRDAVMFEYYVDDAYPYAGPDMLAVRTDTLKLVDNFLEDDIDELYDLKNDPGEMNNLIYESKYEDVEKRLRSELEILKEKYKYNPDRDWWLRQVINEK
ncbi:sulfatase family protein [Marinilabilia rubra]|nr:sulfatase [Marinilabilia rubra]